MNRPLLLAVPASILLVAAGFVPTASAEGPAPAWQAPVPVPVEVIRPFEAPPEPWAAGHRGVDLASSVDAPIRAAADGVVSFAGPVAGRGVVALEHLARGGPATPTLRTTYEPVAPLVREGDRVRRGEVIARLEAGGSHCLDACLHWGLRDLAAEQNALAAGGPYAGSPVYRDPMALLTRARIRLLPRLDRAPAALREAGSGEGAPNPSGAERSAAANALPPSHSSGPPTPLVASGLLGVASVGTLTLRRRLRPG